MDFIDEYDEARPRFVFQARAAHSSPAVDSPSDFKKNKPLIFISLTFSLLFLASSSFLLQSQFLQSLSIWFSLSLLVGPFAPLSLTAGDIRVGQGQIVEFPPQTESVDVDDPKKKVPSKRNRGKRSDLEVSNANGSSKNSENQGHLEALGVDFKEKDDGFLNSEGKFEGGVIQESEWTEEDLGLLRKQIVKHPVGKPRRWEVITEAFRGRHGVESVINKAKSLGNEKPADSDSYSKFLKDRKPVDKRVEGVDGELVNRESGGEGSSWTSVEDVALLNALKAFPKDVAMRWEKIAAAVPGKTKAACMKRVSELKKEFRSSKASNES